MTALLELHGIEKSFGPVQANAGVSMRVSEGQIHGLVGENGAGKTTLMNILYGLYQPDAGRIRWRGEEVSNDSPEDALGLGIGMVHQNFMLVPTLTVAENVALGRQGNGLRALNLASVAAELEALGEAYGLTVDPWAVVQDLSLGERQRVEILKTLVRGADLVILDEPTSVLTPQETHDLFSILQRMKHDGKSVIFISHKLREVLELCDVITVLRNGKVTGYFDAAEVTSEALANAMVGSVPLVTSNRDAARTAEARVVLRVEDLVVVDRDGRRRVDGVSFGIREGEILGLVGVSGNGQAHLVQAIYGLIPIESGRVLLDAEDITGAEALELIRAGIGYIPEERHRDALVLPFTIAENLLSKAYRHPPFCKLRFWLDRGRMGDEAEELRKQYGIQATSVMQRTATLSGGNQQRLVIAREFSLEPRLLLAVQPTQGLDVRSEAYVESMLLEQANAGAAVLLVSTELEQVRRLCHRAAVMFRGRIVGTADPLTASAERFGLLMAGERG